jgi:hypothetical protein
VAEAKIEIKVGAVSFTGEGEGKWLPDQLDKVLQKIPELANVAPVSTPADGGNSGSGHPGTTHQKAKGTLAAFLAAKNAKTNKTRKFLATAVWLHDNENRNRLATSDVTSTVSKNNQGSLGNAAQCLANNVKRGFCIMDGKQFYVADEGSTEIG